MQTLRCERLSKHFNGTRALVNVSMTIPPFGITAIIGPNGAGKTTLINVLTGFTRPDAGRYFVGDREMTGLAPYKIARLGIARTFQDLRLAFQVPVIDNVLLARPRQRGERFLPALLRVGVAKEEARNHEEAMKLLQFVGLEKHTEVLTAELSYGQHKLLALACCLAADARILLLDEPVAGLHPLIASRVLELLQQLREQGKLIVFIEHDISAVRHVADSVIVLDGGEVIAQGRPSDVLERPEIMEAYLA
jgi:ABC-type branched-subunit amino acid transport system ATPase component